MNVHCYKMRVTFAPGRDLSFNRNIVKIIMNDVSVFLYNFGNNVRALWIYGYISRLLVNREYFCWC